MAMMMSSEKHAVLIDFATMDYQPFRLPDDWLFKTVDSGIRRRLSETKFGASSDAQVLSRHATEENIRVRQALSASSVELGALLNASHASQQSIGVSTPEIDDLVAHLQSTPGVLGARMMGGGFGGMILVAVEGSDILPNVPLLKASHCGFLKEGFE